MTSSTRRRIASAFALLALLAVLAWGIGARTIWRPAAPRQIFEQGMAAVEHKNWSKVARAATILKENPEYATESRLLRGIALLKNGRPAAALEEFAALQPTGELRAAALLYTGEAFYRNNQLPEAHRVLSTLAAERPDHVEAHRWLASIAFDLGNYDHALDELEIVEKLDPSDYRPHLLKAYMLTDVNRLRAAADEYALVLAARPPQEVVDEVVPAFARVQIRLREYAAALETISHAEPTAILLALEAECQLGLSRTEAAWKSVELAQESDPEEPEMLRMLARLEIDAGRPNQAIEPLHKALAKNPHHQECRNLLAQALQQLGRGEEAEAERSRLAKTLKLQQRLSDLSKQALVNHRDASVREQLAELYEELGKPETAAIWRKAAAACRQMNATSDANDGVEPNERRPHRPHNDKTL
jgi:tetratricopeptide (TPR) repeat protein